MYNYFEDLIKNKEFKNISEEDIFNFEQEVYSELECR